MADYKDIISGTISNIVGKVKEVANSDTVKGFCEKGADRARSYSRIAKLSLEMNGESEELKRIYAEIGRLFFEKNDEAPEGCYVSLFQQAKRLSNSISEKDEAIKAMKASFESECKDIDVEICDFEVVVDATESEGADCCCEAEKEEDKQE